MTEPPDHCPCCGESAPVHAHSLRAFDVYRCGACTLRFRHPLPRAEELRGMYEDTAYVGGTYFENSQRDYRRDTPEIRIYLQVLQELRRHAPGDRLLDVGSGPGVFLDLAREAGFRARGVELSDPHVRHARATFGVEVWQGDFLEAPSLPASYDAITMWDFLEHVLDPIAVLDRAHQLLKPGGVLVIFTIDSTSLINRIGAALHRFTGSRVSQPLELLYDAHHNWYFTRQSLERLIVAQSFQIDRWYGHRAHLGRWLNEPASPLVVYGGMLLDVASFAVGLPYRRTALCRPTPRAKAS